MTNEELLKQQLAGISEAQAAKTKPIELPKQAGIRYNAQLQKMINLIRGDIEAELIPQIRTLAPEYTTDSWSETIQATLERLKSKWSGSAFERFTSLLASSFVTDVNSFTQNQFSKQTFGINAYNQSVVTDYMQASVIDNARLIKSIPDQYLSQVESIVMGNMRTGLRPSAIVDQLSNQFGVTQRRARVIARDQTSKVANGIARKRMVAAGVKYFKWVDSADEKVRSRHRSISNKVTMYGKGIYTFSDLPLNEKGHPIFCGDDPQCRCVPVPVLESEVIKNQQAGLVAKGAKR